MPGTNDLRPPSTATARRRRTYAIIFGHDALNRRTGITRPNGVDTTLGYDAAGRLTSIAHGALSSFTYGHDALSNRNNLTQTRAALTVVPSLTLPLRRHRSGDERDPSTAGQSGRDFQL